MKNSKKFIATFLLLLPLSLTSFAEDAPAISTTPAANPHKGMPHMGGMGLGMTEEQKTELLKAQQEQILEMHALSNKILAEKDPAKQEALKKEQRDLMKSHREKMMAQHEHMMHQMGAAPKLPAAPMTPEQPAAPAAPAPAK